MSDWILVSSALADMVMAGAMSEFSLVAWMLSVICADTYHFMASRSESVKKRSSHCVDLRRH